MADEVITQAEAARLLGVSRGRVEQLVDAGTLPAVAMHVTVRGVRRLDVERYRRERRGAGRPPAASKRQTGVGHDC